MDDGLTARAGRGALQGGRLLLSWRSPAMFTRWMRMQNLCSTGALAEIAAARACAEARSRGGGRRRDADLQPFA